VFDHIYHTYKDTVFNLALHYVQRVEDAEEITQDVFLSVHQSLASFREDARMSTWIYRITVNKSLDFIRRTKRKKRVGFLTGFFSFESPPQLEHRNFEHPGILMEQKEALERIFRHINDLPERQRTALILSRIEKLPQSAVAEIMQLSVKAVESLIQRAKKKLSDKLNTEGK
jgi:RNA polymerase sigma factor (sigma-70 family)